ncbi:MAG: multifunctional oxoglutarate decarboxylase/oxoglutarate dehydrogenase thiamine pyrophosphate-binding subunit/dihydrolipoyllysine-residue succinyltransferase subunit, partial [Specibacter sp.]
MPEQSIHRLPEEFGGNEWLVDELYERYKSDKSSVDAKWWPLFEGFAADDAAGNGRHTANHATPVTARIPVVHAVAAVASTTPAPAAAVPAPATEAPAATASAPAAQAAAAAPAAAKAPAAPRPPAPAKDAARTGTTPIPAQLPKSAKNNAVPEEAVQTVLRGPAKAIAVNMITSLEVPTATSVRAIPAKLLIDNRVVINSNLARARGGKVSFTHLIGYAVIKALGAFPSMNVYYDEIDGKPVAVQPPHVNFGIAIDMPKPDGTRLLMVPNIKRAETLNFAEFWRTYEDLIKRARAGKLTADDHSGTTVSLTNPGGIGTVHSVPRLSKGQAAIIGVGALDYPAEYQGASPKIIAQNAVSKILTLTSTYDHRVIQGAGSGEFLKKVHQLLLGAENFYDDIFESLRIPYEPVRWSLDLQVDPADEINKVARIQQMIHSYRVRGHLMADTDPLEYVQRKHPDLDVLTYGLTLWDLDREWPTGGFGGKAKLLLRDILGVLRDAYCRTTGVEYMHIQEPEQREWFQNELEHPYSKPSREEQLRIVSKLNSAEAFETFLQTKFVGQKRFSLEGGESLIPLLDSIISDAADDGLDEVAIGMAHRGRLNVLTNIAGKTYAQVFREFEGTQDVRSVQGSGDVKYHLGTEGTFTSDAGNETKVYLA